MLTRPGSVSALGFALLLLAAPAFANDTDGGPDCGRATEDFGDAPEGDAPYPILVPAAFPTCLAPGPVGSVQNVVPIRGTAPGPAGYMRNVQSGSANYWIGCAVAAPYGMHGIDSESDGLYSYGGSTSICSGLPVDCSDIFGGDECNFDNDAGAHLGLINCYAFSGNGGVSVANCGPARVVYLNVLLDLNHDGDWNDNLVCKEPGDPYCFGTCTSPDNAAHEWAVKNLAITIPTGCSSPNFPPMETGPGGDRAIWMRVSLTDEPVDDDYPWAGSANRPGGSYAGGETEDRIVYVSTPLPARRSTWGELKIRYR